LRRTSIPVISAGGPRIAIAPPHILAGILAMRSPWDWSFREKVADSLAALQPDQQLDFGCALDQGTFECTPSGPRSGCVTLHFSTPDETLIFFILRLMVRLRALGTAPAADLMEYGRTLESLRSFRDAA
jgi:hypothetical protein